MEAHRLPITRVSLAQVANQYLAQVRALPDPSADLLADFLSIGGRLVLIKSRTLLLTEEPDPEEEESAADLEERLVAYRVFRAAAERLQELERRDARTYPTLREPSAVDLPAPLAPIKPEALIAAWRRLLRPVEEAPQDVAIVARASVDQRRAAILDALRSVPSVSFVALAGSSLDEVVATFLAVLELFRRGLIDATQSASFTDLLITRPRQAAEPPSQSDGVAQNLRSASVA